MAGFHHNRRRWAVCQLLVQNSGLSGHQLAADTAVVRLSIGRNDPDATCHEVRSRREPNATHMDTRQPVRRFERDLCPPFPVQMGRPPPI
jgi:hypothetical protein